MKKRSLSLMLALCLCIGLATPALAKDLDAATEQDVLKTFHIYRNGSIDEKAEDYCSVNPATLMLGTYDQQEPEEKIYRFISKDDSWTITNTGSKEFSVSGNTDYRISIYVEPFYPERGTDVYVSECLGENWWWGDKNHFVPGFLESGEDGSRIVSLKAGESTTIPASAFIEEGDVGLGFGPIYEVTVSAFYLGKQTEGDHSFDDVRHSKFYFLVDEVMTQGLAPDGAEKSTFKDVKPGDYFADAVKWAVEKEITTGTGDGSTFSPNLTCTRAQILTFLWRAYGSPEPTVSNPFTDVKTGDYYCKAALWAAEKGLVPGSTFGGGTDCTHAMTVEYLWKAAGSPAPAAQASFTDVPANADYAQAVAWAVEKKVTTGTGDGSAFSPDVTCTRGQIATFLHRALG